MDWMKLRSYSRKIRLPKNTHCASPLPGVSKRKAKAKRPTLHQDLLSKLRPEAHDKRQIRNVVTKGLPKIQEISEVTQMNCLSVEQSELNYNENRTVEVNNKVKETDMTPLKDSLNLNSASRKSLINNETTSGMTLPTGVSEFLLDCLDADSTVSSNVECSDSMSIYSSPETFRDDRSSGNDISPQGPCLGCKNSTLLDTSKAINIDKIPQLPDLSNILGGQDRTVTRSLKQKLSSGLSNPSAIVAGKQVRRILPTKELASQSPSSGALLLPPKQNTQLVDQPPRKMKHIKKVKFKSILKNTSTSIVLPSSSGESKSNESCGVMDEMLDVDMELSSRSVNPGKNKALLTSTALLQPKDLELDFSSVRQVSHSEDFLPDPCSLYVNSEEIVPASPSPERKIQQYLCNLPEICSIVKVSPEYRTPKVVQHPLGRKALFFPPGSTEDIITSSKNWVSSNDR